MLYLMKEEQEIEKARSEANWRDQVFLHDRKLYKALYGRPEVNEDDVQWKVPTTMGEVAEVLNELQAAGGPNLDFTYDEKDDDWSFVDKLKKSEPSTEDRTHDNSSDVDAFDALDTQDIDD
jgi:hypothetical protein